ncbi:MCE family protein [Mycobacterium hubeiense]|uniref:MCE family protein n=1 Tax=Mycobacterium hubeiense TaxID=1867256 RepID=UPI000C7F56C2|nr:MCE family protein [Mycobacterium sp. QGD 101]
MITARNARIGLAAVLVVSLIAALIVVVHPSAGVRRVHVVGYFANSNGIFVGDEVRILGVPVGKIDKIEAEPDRVKISFSYDQKQKVPADAKAAILSPSLVSARAIQLTPAYTGGAVMAEGAVIPEQRTAVPVEWDDFRVQLEELTRTLQPTEPGGVSTLGALVNTAADNLRGEGANIRDTIIKLSQSLSALGDHSTDIFASVKNLAILVSALHQSSDLMKQLNRNFAAVTALLADDPHEVGRALRDANAVVGDAQSFLADNRETIGTTSDRLAAVSTALVESLDDIKQALHVAPTAFQNAINMYEPAHASLTGTPAITNFSDPITFLCGAVQAASRMNAEQSAKLCVQYLAPIVKNRQYNFLPFGFNFVVGAQARPNEITYSEDWMRPDYVPPAPPAGPLAAEAPPDLPVATDPAEGLPGMMVPHGGGS